MQATRINVFNINNNNNNNNKIENANKKYTTKFTGKAFKVEYIIFHWRRATFLLLLIEANHFTNVLEKFKLYKISPHDVRTCLYKIGKDY